MKNTLEQNLELRKALAEVDRLTSELEIRDNEVIAVLYIK